MPRPDKWDEYYRYYKCERKRDLRHVLASFSMLLRPFAWIRIHDNEISLSVTVRLLLLRQPDTPPLPRHRLFLLLQTRRRLRLQLPVWHRPCRWTIPPDGWMLY